MSPTAAPTVINNGGEPPAPVFEPVRRDEFPNVALGLPDEPVTTETTTPETTADDGGAGDSGESGGAASTTDAAEKPGAASTEPKTVVGAASAATTTTADKPAFVNPDGSLNWDAVKQTREYQSETATALNKQRDRLKAELDAAKEQADQLAALRKQQQEYDDLLQRADDDSDPIGQAEAQRALTQHIRATRLNEQITNQLRPTVEAAAIAAVQANISKQYEEGYPAVEAVLGKEAVAALHHSQFDHGGKWLETVVQSAYEAGTAAGVTGFRKGDMEKEIRARVAEEVGKVRAGLGSIVDTGESFSGGGQPSGGYQSEQDIHDAIADGRITAGRGRALLAQMTGRQFARR